MDIIEAQEQHLSAITQIYAHHVTLGVASFETEPPAGRNAPTAGENPSCRAAVVCRRA